MKTMGFTWIMRKKRITECYGTRASLFEKLIPDNMSKGGFRRTRLSTFCIFLKMLLFKQYYRPAFFQTLSWKFHQKCQMPKAMIDRLTANLFGQESHNLIASCNEFAHLFRC